MALLIIDWVAIFCTWSLISAELIPINVVSERENYSHVFSAGVPGVDVLLYAKPSDDISSLVLAELGIDPPEKQ